MGTQHPQQHLVKNIHIPFAIIGIANLLGWFHLAPVFIQLLLNSTCCVYIGCVLCSKLQRKPSGELAKHIKKDDSEDQSIDMREAMKFPIIASTFLFGFYILYKYVNKDIVNFLLTLQFSLATVISTSNMLLEFINFSESMNKTLTHVNPPNFLKKYLDFQEFDISIASLITTGVCSIPVILFFITKHWMLNNIFGILFSIVALKNINLSSFKVGFILLWALFFYDIFWVYGTDVMVTVAKNLDIPIKLIFPYLNDVGEEKFSMLGLGDIVVPGIFVSICLKFDVDKCLKESKPTNSRDIKTAYFSICMIGYVLGIFQTFAVMWYFQHPQPALLFLVPMCTIPVAILAFVRKQIKQLEDYSTEDPEKVKAPKKEEDKGILDKLFDKLSGAPSPKQEKSK